MFLKENILFIERVHSKIKQHIYEKKEKALEWFWKNNSPVLNTLKNILKLFYLIILYALLHHNYELDHAINQSKKYWNLKAKLFFSIRCCVNKTKLMRFSPEDFILITF